MTCRSLPALASLETITERLFLVFPPGTPRGQFVRRAETAKTIFVMFYVGAVEDYGHWLRPNQVTRMTDLQSRQGDPESRLAWVQQSLSSARDEIPGRWYKDNTREPTRDEVIRQGLLALGAVIVRPGLPTTSPEPRYALARDFAALFMVDPAETASRIEPWRRQHLSAAGLARVALVRRAVAPVPEEDTTLVTFPSGETRRLAPGLSSQIIKAVIEEFALRYLEKPAVVLLSESQQKVVARDEGLARELGLSISPDRLLPDAILVDLGPPEPLLVFVEVVATDGAITEERKRALTALCTSAGYEVESIAFVTAFLDRDVSPFRKLFPEIAWGAFVWFRSEPDHVVLLSSADGRPLPLSRLLASSRAEG